VAATNDGKPAASGAEDGPIGRIAAAATDPVGNSLGIGAGAAPFSGAVPMGRMAEPWDGAYAAPGAAGIAAGKLPPNVLGRVRSIAAADCRDDWLRAAMARCAAAFIMGRPPCVVAAGALAVFRNEVAGAPILDWAITGSVAAAANVANRAGHNILARSTLITNVLIVAMILIVVEGRRALMWAS
jgi:hypothetical protein